MGTKSLDLDTSSRIRLVYDEVMGTVDKSYRTIDENQKAMIKTRVVFALLSAVDRGERDMMNLLATGTAAAKQQA